MGPCADPQFFAKFVQAQTNSAHTNKQHARRHNSSLLPLLPASIASFFLKSKYWLTTTYIPNWWVVLRDVANPNIKHQWPSSPLSSANQPSCSLPIPFVSQLVRPFIIRLLTSPGFQDSRTPFYLVALSTFLHCPFSHFLKLRVPL